VHGTIDTLQVRDGDALLGMLRRLVRRRCDGAVAQTMQCDTDLLRNIRLQHADFSDGAIRRRFIR
jgi:hypothetical protein